MNTLAFERDHNTGNRTARVALLQERRYELRKERGAVVAECFLADELVARTRAKTFKAATAWCSRDLATAR